MPTTRRSRTVTAPPEAVWKVIADAHHMPRWWPGVDRVQGVSDDGFTQIYVSKRGRNVRMDFRVLGSESPSRDGGLAGRRMWEQELDGTPFQRVLSEAVTEIVLSASGEDTLVTIEQRQRMRGTSRFGGFQIRRAAARTLDGALEGLQRILG